MVRSFTPPVAFEHSQDFFFGRFKIEVGLSVVKVNGHYVTSPYPWMGDLADLTEGTDYFLGGRTYEVTDAVADALIEDGYSTSATDPPGFGQGAFGEGGFGE